MVRELNWGWNLAKGLLNVHLVILSGTLRMNVESKIGVEERRKKKVAREKPSMVEVGVNWAKKVYYSQRVREKRIKTLNVGFIIKGGENRMEKLESSNSFATLYFGKNDQHKKKIWWEDVESKRWLKIGTKWRLWFSKHFNGRWWFKKWTW